LFESREEDSGRILEAIAADLQKKAKAAKQESDLTPEENKRVEQAFENTVVPKLEECLRGKGLSEKGSERISEAMRAEMREGSK